MNPVAKQVGHNCAQARKQAGLTQHALANRLFIHPNDISRLENGRSCPRLTTLLRLARALEVPFTDLLDGIEWTTQPGREQQLQRALLALLLHYFPRKLKREDLERRYNFDGPVVVPIEELHAAGLIWCEGDYVMPTLPARHMEWLELV